MHTAIATLSLEEVADLIGRGPVWLRRHYKRLVEEEGFPLRMTGGRFYAPAIERWMQAQSGLQPAALPDPLADQRRHLTLIYGGRA